MKALPNISVCRQGFTLIELLTVLGIIAILVALLYPVFLSARADTAKVVCISNLRQIGVAIALYTQDYDVYLPYAPDPITKSLLLMGISIYGDPIDTAARKLPDIKAILLPYKAINAIFRCPWDRRTLDIIDPAAKATYFETYGSSYQYNDWNALRITPLSYFQKPADSFLMGDDECFHNRPDDNSCGFFNVLYIDFHVKSLTIAQREDAIDNTDRSEDGHR